MKRLCYIVYFKDGTYVTIKNATRVCDMEKQIEVFFVFDDFDKYTKKLFYPMDLIHSVEGNI